MQEQIAVCVSDFPCFTANGENFTKIGERSAAIAALRAKNNEKNCNSFILFQLADIDYLEFKMSIKKVLCSHGLLILSNSGSPSYQMQTFETYCSKKPIAPSTTVHTSPPSSFLSLLFPRIHFTLTLKAVMRG